MKTSSSPYHRPWIWLMRKTALIALLVLPAWLVCQNGVSGVAEMVAVFGLVCAIVIVTLETMASILVAGFCQWIKATGGGMGELVASIRHVRRR